MLVGLTPAYRLGPLMARLVVLAALLLVVLAALLGFAGGSLHLDPDRTRDAVVGGMRWAGAERVAWMRWEGNAPVL